MAGGAGRPAGAPPSAISQLSGQTAASMAQPNPNAPAFRGAMGAFNNPSQGQAASAAAQPAPQMQQLQQLQQMQQMMANPQVAMMQRLGINRTPYNPQSFLPGSYASARAPQIFQPQLRPQQQSAQTAAQADPEYQAWLAQRNGGGDGNGGGGGGGGGGN